MRAKNLRRSKRDDNKPPSVSLLRQEHHEISRSRSNSKGKINTSKSKAHEKMKDKHNLKKDRRRNLRAASTNKFSHASFHNYSVFRNKEQQRETKKQRKMNDYNWSTSFRTNLPLLGDFSQQAALQKHQHHMRKSQQQRQNSKIQRADCVSQIENHSTNRHNCSPELGSGRGMRLRNVLKQPWNEILYCWLPNRSR